MNAHTLVTVNVRNADVYRPAVGYTRNFATSKSKNPADRNTAF
jgi:hypothetical protein